MAFFTSAGSSGSEVRSGQPQRSLEPEGVYVDAAVFGDIVNDYDKSYGSVQHMQLVFKRSGKAAVT